MSQRAYISRAYRHMREEADAYSGGTCLQALESLHVSQELTGHERGAHVSQELTCL
jgi:hypothetical protein